MRRRIDERPRYCLPGTSVQAVPLVRAACGTGIATSAILLLVLSPALSVQDVAWTGNLRPGKSVSAAVEKASLGCALALLPTSRLRALLPLSPEEVRVEFVRRWPRSLEVRVCPRRAAFVDARGTAFDGEGRVLEARHALRGVTRIEGFARAADGHLEPADARLLQQLRRGLGKAAFAIARIERRGDDVLLEVEQPKAKILLSATDLAVGLRKLAMLEATLSSESLPARIDLRFRDQIVTTPRQGEAERGRS